jgi:hypothetical protein
MPVFRFKTRHGRDIFEGDGVELATLRDGSLDPDREWRMDVMNGVGPGIVQFAHDI